MTDEDVRELVGKLNHMAFLLGHVVGSLSAITCGDPHMCHNEQIKILLDRVLNGLDIDGVPER
jgi:hypothetical protein